VSLTTRALSLPAKPPSVRLARTWVRDSLAEIGRHELVDSAQLGVSELVTNALLHGEPPVEVRLRGTREHPRIEVTDRSTLPPRVPRMILDDAETDVIPTFGRGLSLVAMMSARWGADLDHDRSGKSVWFEPVSEMNADADLKGEVFDALEAFREESPVQPPAETVRIELRNFPAQMFRRLRVHQFELRRELRLLAMTDPQRYPIATAVTRLNDTVEHDRRATTGVRSLDRAIRRGDEHLDLVYDVPVGAPERMVEVHDMITEAYRVFGDERLLTVVPPPELLALQEWYFGEFARQSRGEPPIPWDDSMAEGSGEDRDEDSDHDRDQPQP
jgi:anti-sigma regulatory factor (Ser/Thr protein kinase)